MIDPGVFAGHVGSDFTVESTGGPVTLRLAKVDDAGVANGIHQFSLFFHGPADRQLPDQIHTFAHPVLGTNDIFVVPVQGSTATRIVYQACFGIRV